PPMFLEDVLEEVEKFVTNEGPRLLRDGGKISVTNNILPVVQSLQNLIEEAHDPVNISELPDGFRTARVRNSLDDLQDQLEALFKLTEQVEQGVREPEEKLNISGVMLTDNGDDSLTLSILGEGFEPGSVVTINSATAIRFSGADIEFFSAERIDVTFDATE